MIKVNISDNNSSNLLAQTNVATTCGCYVCGSCTFCIIFAPIVGAVLSIVLSPSLVSEQAV